MRDSSDTSDILERAMKSVGQAILTHSGFIRRANPLAVTQYLGYIRDEQMWEMPYLNGAAMVFQQLSSGREWNIVGRPRPALKAVDWLNAAQSYDIDTGLTFYGFEEYLKRRAIDYIAVGRTAFYVKKSARVQPLEYIDPTLLSFQRTTSTPRVVSPSEKVWKYGDNRSFRSDELTVSNTLPVGGRGIYLSPVSFILPAALLAWLLQEHDTSALDGRRIRDVLIVGDANLGQALEQAILTQIAIASGENPNDVGVPIVEMNNISGIPMADNITTLGLSKIPEAFNREEFIFSFVNQISAVLGLSLRHFWNSERTTNKALEEIQEQRQLQKGPSSFVRTEQTLLNQSGVLKQFIPPTSRERLVFSFVEEVDASRAKVNAEVLKATAEALSVVKDVFGASISLQALLAWMQSLYVMPADLELISDDPSVLDGSGENTEDEQITSSPTNLAQEDEVATGGDAPNASNTSNNKSVKSAMNIPEYGEVVVSRDGKIVEKRVRMFDVKTILRNEIRKDLGVKPEPQEDFDSIVRKVQLNNVGIFKTLIVTKKGEIGKWIESQRLFSLVDVTDVIENPDEINTPIKQAIVDFVVGEFSD